MRILAYSHNFHPIVGGIVTYCDSLCAAMIAAGEELASVVPYGGDTEIFSYPIIRMSVSLASDRISLPGYWDAARQLSEVVKKFKPDVLWCCSLDAVYVVSLLKIDAALAVTLHGSEISKNFGSSNPLKLLRAWMIQRTLSKAHRIVTVSNYTKGLVVKYLPQFADKVDVVHNGLAIAPIVEKEGVNDCQYKKVDSVITLLSVGRLAEFKGFHRFPEILYHLIQYMPHIRWVIAGEGDFRSTIVDSIHRFGLRNHVEFLGWVAQEQLGEIYKNSDMMVHPAIKDSEGRDESFGLVLIEAMMHGCPVAVTGAGGTGEIIEDGRTGIIFDVEYPVGAGEKLAG